MKRHPESSTRPSAKATQLRELFRRVTRNRSMRDPISSMCEELQLTSPQAHSLIWLGYEGPLTMGMLAHRASIHDKSITGVVDRLEKMGLVERVRSPEDRRAVSVQLTAEGRKVYEQLDHLIDLALDRLLSLLEPEDQEALFRLLERLAERVKSLKDPSSEESES